MQVNQPDLAAAIMKYLKANGVVEVNARQFNAVLEAATMIVDAMDSPHKVSVPGEGLQDWWMGDETGISSRAMARHLAPLAGIKFRMPDDRPGGFGCHPHDPADLLRCVKLLKAVPELVPFVPRMAEVNKYWAGLIAIWDELVALLDSEMASKAGQKTSRAPKTYARMRAVLDPLEGIKR